MNKIVKYIIALIVLIFISANNLIAQVDVSIQDTTAKSGKRIEIPIIVSDLTGYGIRSYRFRLNYDQEILKIKSIIDDETLSDRRTWDIDADLEDEGLIIEASGWYTLSGSGTLLILKFQVIAEEGSTELSFDSFSFNYGYPTVNIYNGSFTVYNEQIVKFNMGGNGEGKISIDGELIDLPYESAFVKGMNYSLEAYPDENSMFTGWTGDVNSSQNPFLITIDNEINIIPTFEIKTHAISAQIYPDGAGNVTGVGIYQYGDTVTLVANPYSGNEFLNWSIDGNIVSENSEFYFTAHEDFEIVANFGQTLFQITTMTNPVVAGQVTGAGYYYLNQDAQLVAQSNTGWRFNNWSENDQIISEDSLLTINIQDNRNLSANFETITSFSPEDEFLTTPITLYEPYPNPFNPETVFRFFVNETAVVTLNILDVSGKLVTQIYRGDLMRSGSHQIKFQGSGLSSGVYFYYFRASEIQSSTDYIKKGKIILLK